MLQEFSGATVRRTLDRSRAEVPEHAHDWPLLSLFVIGSYSNHTEIGERSISGPSAVFYPAGAAHRNTAGPDGFEQIEIEFDPTWLRDVRLPAGPVLRWTGSRGGAETRALVAACNRGLSEAQLLAALRRFLESVPAESGLGPAWLDGVTRQFRDDPTRKVSDLAREAGLHPSWLGTAYRRATGEGLLDAAARFRVEHATRMLRETDAPFSGIAMDAGFCDQSHMIRTFRRVLGRLPSAVREDRSLFRGRALL
ncbi:MAG TPA: helix-turn-helix transcriptional regulator [Gammaproteobacteria bacterium]|jgi:AraC family transcriptional regulator